MRLLLAPTSTKERWTRGSGRQGDKMRLPLSEVKSEAVRKDFQPIRGKLGEKYGVVLSIDVVVTETEYVLLLLYLITLMEPEAMKRQLTYMVGLLHLVPDSVSFMI